MSIGILLCVLALLLFFISNRKRKEEMIRRMILAKKESREMFEIAQKFIGKECIIYLFNEQVAGTITEVTQGAMVVESNGECQALNLDFVARIREYPRGKNGKKKSLVLD